SRCVPGDLLRRQALRAEARIAAGFGLRSGLRLLGRISKRCGCDQGERDGEPASHGREIIPADCGPPVSSHGFRPDFRKVARPHGGAYMSVQLDEPGPGGGELVADSSVAPTTVRQPIATSPCERICEPSASTDTSARSMTAPVTRGAPCAPN